MGLKGLSEIQWDQSFTPRENSRNIPFPAAISKSYLSAAYKMHYSNESKNPLLSPQSE